jgi:hypothetical protein
MRAIPSWLRGTSLPCCDSSSFAGSSLAYRGGEPTGSEPYRPCRLALGTGKSDPVRIAGVRHRRAVGGDVVGHALPEERPRRGDLSVGVIGEEVDAQIARAAGASERVQRRLVGLQRRVIGE